VFHPVSSSQGDCALTPSSGWRSRLADGSGVAGIALGLALAAGFVTRVALLLKTGAEATWDFSLIGSFAAGLIFDCAAALWWTAPLALLTALVPRRWFTTKAARWISHAMLFGITYALLFGAVAEWVFWDEFGARFNFIAVDYLVYTTEVIGNIRESYPMPAIYGGLLVVTWLVYLPLFKGQWVERWLSSAMSPQHVRARRQFAGMSAVALMLLGGGLQQRFLPDFANNYNRELAKNGLWSLIAAFRDNQLDFERFYPTMPEAEAFGRTRQLLAVDGAQRLTDDPRDFLRLVRHDSPEQRLNVIQITVESLSADLLGRYGNTQDLTPNIDALIPQALVFDQLYATGNRTDRGMEALTLSVPPTPGRSLVKRPHNEHLFTLGSVFRSRGYDTAFIYGGFGYFDNMNHFFGENGYRVVDRTKVGAGDITFANVWGACDEDLFRWALREADRSYAAGEPFFQFVMTTSNHRPFTFPAGRIDLPSKTAGRAGGVKYTDYAIGQLLRAAASKPWFKNTVFVIVADHCASSAGKTELPVDKYHIPMIVYAPGGQVKPGVVRTLASQVDYGPTLLGLLHWTYPSRFYGRDLLAGAKPADERAWIGNYQRLGLLRVGELGVLKPVRRSSTLTFSPGTSKLAPGPNNTDLIDDTIAFYQTASWLFKHGQQQELTRAELDGARRVALAAGHSLRN
jgi:phosphoglycerol transferase MdoB-like AlkP superfamily enzyme